jgi:hypothetical protein
MNRVMRKVKLAATAHRIVGVTNNQMPAYHPKLPCRRAIEISVVEG